MTTKDKATNNDAGDGAVAAGESVVMDSRFRLIVVAALRSKQLLHGATPRIVPDPLRRRNTSIALEEIRQGLVPFTLLTKDQMGDGDH